MKRFFKLIFVLFLVLNFTYSYAANQVKIDKNTLKSIFVVDGEKTGFMKDKNGVYYVDSGNPNKVKIKTITSNPSSFILVGCYKISYENNCYYKDSGKIFNLFANENSITLKEIKDADIDTFKFVKKGYARDKNKVYYSTYEIKGALLDSFKPIDRFYSSDDNSVFKGIYKIAGADPKTFVVIDTSMGYSRDEYNAYYETNEIRGISLKTFKILDYHYSRDENNIFFNANLIDSADVKTFEIIKSTGNNFYSRDKNHVYLNGKIMEGVDPKTFKVK